MRQLLTDVRWTFRFLRRNPLFATGVVVTLALGIGANTAVFSFVSSFLLTTPPMPEPERLVRVFPQFEGGIQSGNFSVPEHTDLRQGNSAYPQSVHFSM